MNHLVIGFMTFVIASTTSSAYASVLVNGSFETGVYTIGGNIDKWGVDPAAYVSAENGITPLDGSRMIRFDATSNAPAGGSTGSNVQQFRYLPSLGINPGDPLSFSAAFNRVDFDSETDTQFRVRLAAFDGGAGAPSSQLAEQVTDVFSDADLSTWEMATVDLVLPAGATWVLAELLAIEDVFNDIGGASEFDGHYADRATLLVVPEPASLALLGLGGLFVARRRRVRSTRHLYAR